MSSARRGASARLPQTLWQRTLSLLGGIRVRLTLWYIGMTILILMFLEGLLYSTILKMLPSLDHTNLPQMILQFCVLGLVILLFIAAGGYWFATRAMRPVRLITQLAREIGRTDLSRRLHLKRRDELGELAETFDEMLNRIEALLQYQRQFTADASHELRTPLTILSLAASRALTQNSQPENYAQALTSIESYRQTFLHMEIEIGHMTRLVNDLLLLARADAGQAILTPVELDMSEVALEVVERMVPLARELGLELALGALPELPVCGDHMLLTALLTNLIDNALKYTSGHGSQVQVQGGIASREGQRWSWLAIEDNGPGIGEEHLPHLFERFYRVDRARSQLSSGPEAARVEIVSGSGLGLAIAQWVVQAHRGEIQVRSTVGSGSCFELWLPLFAE